MPAVSRLAPCLSWSASSASRSWRVRRSAPSLVTGGQARFRRSRRPGIGRAPLVPEVRQGRCAVSGCSARRAIGPTTAFRCRRQRVIGETPAPSWLRTFRTVSSSSQFEPCADGSHVRIGRWDWLDPWLPGTHGYRSVPAPRPRGPGSGNQIALGACPPSHTTDVVRKATCRDRITGPGRGIAQAGDDLIGRRGSSERDPDPGLHAGSPGCVSPIAPWPGCQRLWRCSSACSSVG